jgi:hypothetical protein
MHAIGERRETIPVAMTWSRVTSLSYEAEPAMNSRINDNGGQLDRKTCRSICDAVGERLQQNLRPDTSQLSSHLQHLLDELRKRDIEGRPMASN